ncbi:unnamed protein product [Calypogeia fissa]
MANRAKGLASGLSKWFKKPWEVTGPVSTQEFKDPMPMAGVYRENSPATQPQRAIIPHAEPEHVFDIKYYVRDTRREPPKVTVMDVPANFEFEGTAPPAGKFFIMGQEFPVTDEPGGGYQK